MVLKELCCKFLFWECVLVIKELIFNNLYFGKTCWGLERTPFLSVFTFGRCDCLERIDL